MTVKLLPEVQEIIKDAMQRYPSEISKANSVAEQKLRKLKNFHPDVADNLVKYAIHEAVCAARGRYNSSVKRNGNGGNNNHSKNGKVVQITEGVNQVLISVYHYHLAGTILGELFGAELNAIATKERNIAKGHTFNAMLLEWLEPIVPAEKTVREAVPEKKLWKKFEELRKKANEGNLCVV